MKHWGCQTCMKTSEDPRQKSVEKTCLLLSYFHWRVLTHGRTSWLEATLAEMGGRLGTQINNLLVHLHVLLTASNENGNQTLENLIEIFSRRRRFFQLLGEERVGEGLSWER